MSTIYFFPWCVSTRFRVMAYPYGASRSQSLDTPHSVGLLWTSDQPDAETCTWHHATLIRDGYPCPWAGFEPAIPACERLQIHVLDRAATGIGTVYLLVLPCLRWLVAFFSLRRPSLDSRRSLSNLWWTEWQWGRFFSEKSCFSLSLAFHHCSISFICRWTLYNDSNWHQR